MHVCVCVCVPAQEELSAKATAVHGIERSIREIATLNQLFATAVQHQAAQIESIYEQAVEASLVSLSTHMHPLLARFKQCTWLGSLRDENEHACVWAHG